jgi:hypothetical protein
MTTRRTYGVYLGDLNRASNSSHGIINYAVALAVNLSKLVGPDERLVVYANPEIAKELGEIDSPLTEIRRVPLPRNDAHRLALDGRVVWQARKDGVEVLHFPKGILPLGLPRRRPALVVTIHDDIPMRYAESEAARAHLPTRLRNTLIAKLFMRSLRKADRVITISRLSRDALLAREPAAGGARGIEVIGSISTLPALPFVPRAERAPLLLHLASVVPHKNTAFTIASTLRYFRERSSDLRLLLLGTVPDGVSVDDARIDHRRGPVTNAEMAAAMSTSRGLLFVSSMEGYGLPPVEAWAYGTPSIYDSAPSLEEMGLDVPMRLPVHTYEAFAAALDTILALDDTQLLELRDTVMSGPNGNDLTAPVLRVYRELVQS